MLRYYHVVVIGSLSNVSVWIEEYKVHVCVKRENCCLIRLVTLLAAVVDSTYKQNGTLQ